MRGKTNCDWAQCSRKAATLKLHSTRENVAAETIIKLFYFEGGKNLSGMHSQL